MKNPFGPALELELPPLGEKLEVSPRKVVMSYFCFTKIQRAVVRRDGRLEIGRVVRVPQVQSF